MKRQNTTELPLHCVIVLLIVPLFRSFAVKKKHTQHILYNIPNIKDLSGYVASMAEANKGIARQNLFDTQLYIVRCYNVAFNRENEILNFLSILVNR